MRIIKLGNGYWAIADNKGNLLKRKPCYNAMRFERKEGAVNAIKLLKQGDLISFDLTF